MTVPVPLLVISGADFGWIVLGLVLMFLALSVVVLSLTWLERKVLGRLQRRLGPTRTGPMGLMQPLADALKLILKEDIIPSSADRSIFWAAPIIVIVSAFMIWVTIPGTQDAVLQNLDLGLFYIIAFAVVGILGLVLAGWGSANKYGHLGGLRAAAQLISYEIPVIMVVISVAMLAESLDLREIVAARYSSEPGELSLSGGAASWPGHLLHRRAGGGRTHSLRYLLCRIGDRGRPLRGI